MNDLKIVPETEFEEKEFVEGAKVYKTKKLDLIVEIPRGIMIGNVIVKPEGAGYGFMY